MYHATADSHRRYVLFVLSLPFLSPGSKAHLPSGKQDYVAKVTIYF